MFFFLRCYVFSDVLIRYRLRYDIFIMYIFCFLRYQLLCFFCRKESGIGAGIDSYYEYLLKAYIFLGDETYLHRFNTHYLVRCSNRYFADRSCVSLYATSQTVINTIHPSLD